MDKDSPILSNSELNTEGTKCTPPYADCLHGHFYKAALALGYNDSDAERLTERVKLLTQIDEFEVQTNIPHRTWYNMSKVKEFIKQSILELPTELQADAIRVVYRIYYQNIWHTTMEATIDIHRFIYSTFPDALTGDTYYWTFEKWKADGELPFMHPGEEKIYNQGTMKWETDILQEKEYVKILDYAKEWCEQYIQFNLNKLKQPFLDKYNRTEKPKELLKKERKEYKKLIKDKSIALETSVNADRILFIKRPGQSNFIPDLYQYLVVEASFNPLEHARPNLPFDMVLNIRELLVLVVSRYLDFLSHLTEKTSQQPTLTNEEEFQNSSPSKDKKVLRHLTVEECFKSPELFKTTLRALEKLELIGSENQWLGKKTELGTLKDALENRSYFNDEVPKSDEKLVPLLAQLFKTTISDRATRERPKNHGELKKELIALLPFLP